MKDMIAKQRRVKKQSTLQLKRRYAYLLCTKAWRETVIENKTELWNIYANNHPSVNKQGKVTKLTGFNWFIKINIYRTYNNLQPILIPPTD